MTKKIKVIHVITSMLQDGAQHMLLRLLSNLDQEKFDSRVINLRGETPLVQEFEKRGFPVHSVDTKKSDIGSIYRLLKMKKLVVAEQPDILQGWMEHGNLCASWLAGRCTRRPAVIWNIRRSLYNLKHDKLNTKIVLHLCKYFSTSPKGIIFCAKEAMNHYGKFGFSLKNAIWIPNGFELDRLKNYPGAAEHLCKTLGLPTGSILVGNIGRYHPNKDHAGFLKAAAIVIQQRPDVHFVCIGRAVLPDNSELMSLVEDLGISDNIHLIGPRTDLPLLIPGFSVFCLASRTEGFPNVVGEAMCCEVPCVVTDSGATKELVEGVGTIVEKENPAKMAEAILMTLSRTKEDLAAQGIAARNRIREHYTIEAVIGAYSQLYSNTATRISS